MEWLAHDELVPTELPAWARTDGERRDGKPYSVQICTEGLTLTRGGRGSALRWEEILVPIRLDDPRRLLISAARRPPLPPWFELGGDDVAAIERAVRIRFESVDHRGYREGPRRRTPLDPEETLASVLARQPIGGAVEIPAATANPLRSAGVGALVGGVVLGFYGAFLGPPGAIAGAALGGLGGGGLLGMRDHMRAKRAGRVLVLTPDAYVGGLDGESVRAVPWPEVGRFGAGVADGGSDALEVYSPSHEVLSRVPARFFGKPLEIIVAIAEAYRRRAVGEDS